MAYNGNWLCEVGDFGDEISNRSNFHPNLAKPLVISSNFFKAMAKEQFKKLY